MTYGSKDLTPYCHSLVKDMRYSGENLGNVKQSNRAAIRRLLYAFGPLPRRDIARKLGLTPASVTLITNDMIRKGQLEELGIQEESGRSGRKSILIGIRGSWKRILAVRIEADGSWVSVTDLKGKLLDMTKISFTEGEDVRELLRKIISEIHLLLGKNTIGEEELLGIGISIPGPIDRKEGIALHAYRISDTAIPLREIFSRHFHCPILIDNNVYCFSRGELLFGCGRKSGNVLFFKWGPGIGAAFSMNGKLYRGERGQITEIGHSNVIPDGKRCRCGRRGCLETVASTHAILEEIRSLFSEKDTKRLCRLAKGRAENLEFAHFSEYVSCGDPSILEKVDEIVYYVARSLMNAMAILRPDRVVVYGYHFQIRTIWDLFIRKMTEYEPDFHEGYVKLSDFIDQAGYIGPCALVIEELFVEG